MITRVLTIGLGEIGKANARYLSSLKSSFIPLVYGHDVRLEAIESFYNEKLILNISPIEHFYGFDYYLVCVSTHNPNDINQPDLSALRQVVNQIENQASCESLVCLESTIPIGFCNEVGEQLHKKGIHLVHCPERYYAPEKDLGHGINQKRVLGYYSSCCEPGGIGFYRSGLDIPIHIVPDIRIAEASKIVENANRFAKIALIEEHYLWAKSLGIDADLLIDALHTKWNSDKLFPMKGIGGHCLPKDSQMYVNSSKESKLIATALEVDNEYQTNLLDSTQK